ncbi:hypothetical protein OIU79_003505 [Salix purpurea]|uniref:Uncharacterized protein n=1 Tax=Salix purpurea TaxID=77065 RepID=A0A9Q0UM46_SALPP|nr:hypothetical protein OIU79_003505 [Salix purpurea]
MDLFKNCKLHLLLL